MVNACQGLDKAAIFGSTGVWLARLRSEQPITAT
jgi:hypothetical protein